MKVGDEVKLTAEEIYKKYYADDQSCEAPSINCGNCVSKTMPGNDLCIKKIRLFVEGEKTMKDTITLRELIEQDACKDGVLWFMDLMVDNKFDYASPETQHTVTRPYHPVNKFTIKSIIECAKEQDKPQYITWLKEHGYAVDDKDSKIRELNERVNDLQAEIRKLQDD